MLLYVRGILEDTVREEETTAMTSLASLLCPEVCVSMFGLTVTSSSWDFYQSSIAPYLSTSYHISASYIGKLFSSSPAKRFFSEILILISLYLGGQKI